MFPSTWVGYISCEAKKHVVDFVPDMAVAALALARECAVPAILPCCLWEYFTPVSASDQADEARAQPHILEDGRPYAVDANIITQCDRVGWALAERRQASVLSMLDADDFCGDTCRDEARIALGNIICSRGDFPLLSKASQGYWDDYALCDNCVEEIVNTWNGDMQRLWNNLPSFYNLGSWDELRAASN
jgi:hypothetical protein